MKTNSLSVDRFVTKNQILVHDVIEVPLAEQPTEWVVLMRCINPSNPNHLMVYAQHKESYDRTGGNGFVPLFDLSEHDMIYVKEHLF